MNESTTFTDDPIRPRALRAPASEAATGADSDSNSNSGIHAQPRVRSAARLDHATAGAARSAGASISVIIPTLNEEAHLARTLEIVMARPIREVFVVDAGSRDSTVEIARAFGAEVLSNAPRGRAMQMNYGASLASGEILLFQHADTRLPVDFDEHISAAMRKSPRALGAFRLCIDSPRRSFRWIECAVAQRSKRLRRPYGDQSLFMRREVFEQLGGYREIPIMEDYDLVRRAAKRGRVRVLEACVTTSARRWLADGVIRTTLCNQGIALAYRLGVSPARLARWRGCGR